MSELISDIDEVWRRKLRHRAERALSLTLFWVKEGMYVGSDSHAPLARGCALLAQAALADPPEHPAPWLASESADHPWRDWIGLLSVEARAKAEGPDSLASRWLMSLPEYQPGGALSPSFQMQYGYLQMKLHSPIRAAWELSGVYCENSPKVADLCEAIAMRESLSFETEYMTESEIGGLVSKLEASALAYSQKEILEIAAAAGFKPPCALRV